MVNLIPTIGPFLLPLLLPTLTVMLANGCRAIERGQTFDGEALLFGLSARRVGLVRLGGLHLIGSSLVVLGGYAFGEPINISDGMSQEEAAALLTDLGILMVLASPMLMAFWFAPLLTAWNGVSAGKSLFFSFVASWRNWRCLRDVRPVAGSGRRRLAGFGPGRRRPDLAALVRILSVALRLLLIFVLAPTMVASVYLSYRDVFEAREAVEPAPVLPDE